MHAIEGKQTRELDAATIAAWASRYHDLTVDLGTGDGRFVRHLARLDLARGAIGVDTHGANLRLHSRGAPDNALFVVADALVLPPELRRLATRVTVNFPWGSLLRGLLDGHDGLLAGLRAVGRPGASLEITLNAGALAEAGWGLEAGVQRVAMTLERSGFRVRPVRAIGPDQLRRFPTTWAKRLAFGRDPRAVGIRAVFAQGDREPTSAVPNGYAPSTTGAKIAASPSAIVTPVASWRLN